MSVTTCALSGQPLIEPAVSIRTGHVFEKGLILKQIEASGQCPITGVNLAASDLVDLQVAKSAAPKPVGANSMPGMLRLLQNEWDTLMLEVYTLKKNLEQARKELSHALYQHDAACQVICRLLGEKDQLVAQLEENQVKTDDLTTALAKQSAMPLQTANVEESKHQEPAAIDKALIQKMEELSDQLIQERRQTKAPANYPTKEGLTQFQESASIDMKTENGVTEVDTPESLESNLVIASSGKEVKVFNSEKNTELYTMNPFNEVIGLVRFAPKSEELAIIASAESNRIAIWNIKTQTSVYDVTCHKEVITDVAFTPLEGYLMVASRDGSWSLHDYFNKAKLNQFRESAPVTQIQIHPDGLVMAIGLTSGKVLIYDIREMKVAQELAPPKEDVEVSKLVFSNKGVYLAAAWKGLDNCRVYSLHKECLYTDLAHDGNVISSIAFDKFGGFLMTAAGNNIVLFNYKNWKKPITAIDIGLHVSSAMFDSSCSKIFAGSAQSGIVKVLSL